jgi:hypothetical protein
MVGGPIWMIWAAPASVVLIAFIYGAAFIGQGLSAEEMFELRAFVEYAVREVSGADREQARDLRRDEARFAIGHD